MLEGLLQTWTMMFRTHKCCRSHFRGNWVLVPTAQVWPSLPPEYRRGRIVHWGGLIVHQPMIKVSSRSVLRRRIRFLGFRIFQKQTQERGVTNRQQYCQFQGSGIAYSTSSFRWEACSVRQKRNGDLDPAGVPFHRWPCRQRQQRRPH